MKKITALIFVFSSLLVSGCGNDDAQTRFESQAYTEPANITETSFQGDVVRVDSDDWRTSPLYVGLANVDPIFPNPVQYGSNVNLEVELNGAPVSTILELGYLNESNTWVPLQIQDVTSDFELVTFLVNTRQFGNSADQVRGIYRMLLFDGNQRLISYGDLLIQ